MGDKPLLPHPYHLSNVRLHLLASILALMESWFSISLGPSCPLMNRETLEVFALLLW